jgi:predicted nuclease of predicted toxin-antitoxin system
MLLGPTIRTQAEDDTPMTDFPASWFEVTDDLLREPGRLPQALKLLVDENIPAGLVSDLQAAGVNCVTAASAGVGGHEDEDVFERATRLDRVLLTADRNERWIHRSPRDARKAGVIVVPSGDRSARTALGLVLGTFALRYGRWRGATVLAGEKEFRLVSKGSDGARVSYRFRLQAQRLMALEESAGERTGG